GWRGHARPPRDVQRRRARLARQRGDLERRPRRERRRSRTRLGRRRDDRRRVQGDRPVPGDAIAMRRGVFVVLLFASPAHAGRTLYGWLPETDTVADGGIELQTSIYEHDNLGPYHERTTGLVWTPAIGLTRCLELAIPVE